MYTYIYIHIYIYIHYIYREYTNKQIFATGNSSIEVKLTNTDNMNDITKYQVQDTTISTN